MSHKKLETVTCGHCGAERPKKQKHCKCTEAKKEIERKRADRKAKKILDNTPILIERRGFQCRACFQTWNHKIEVGDHFKVPSWAKRGCLVAMDKEGIGIQIFKITGKPRCARERVSMVNIETERSGSYNVQNVKKLTKDIFMHQKLS